MARRTRIYRVLYGTARLLAQAGQGIKFSQHAHNRLAGALAPGAGKTGGNPCQAGFHLEALLLQQLFQQRCGFVLMEGQFGILPDVVIGVQNPGGVFCHRFPDQFQIGHLGHSS